jgi:hypothetical protein
MFALGMFESMLDEDEQTQIFDKRFSNAGEIRDRFKKQSEIFELNYRIYKVGESDVTSFCICPLIPKKRPPVNGPRILSLDWTSLVVLDEL